MLLQPGCPRCPREMADAEGSWRCPDHGAGPALWRPEETGYDALSEHLALAGEFPTLLPWPLRPGWAVSDFGVVAGDGAARATITAVAGTTTQDGPVELVVVAEEPGTGLGARCAGTVHSDPGAEIEAATPEVRVFLESQSVPLWSVSVPESGRGLDRSVVAGEAHGRWLWLVVRPAPAILLLAEDWTLSDVSGMGAALLDLPFGGTPSAW